MNECTPVLHRLRCGGKEMMNEWSALTGQQEGNTLHNRWTEGWIILSLPPQGSCLFGCYRCTECFVVYILIFDMIRTQVIIKTLTTRNSYCHTDLDTVIELLSNMLSIHHYLMMKMNL